MLKKDSLTRYSESAIESTQIEYNIGVSHIRIDDAHIHSFFFADILTRKKYDVKNR